MPPLGERRDQVVEHPAPGPVGAARDLLPRGTAMLDLAPGRDRRLHRSPAVAHPVGPDRGPDVAHQLQVGAAGLGRGAQPGQARPHRLPVARRLRGEPQVGRRVGAEPLQPVQELVGIEREEDPAVVGEDGQLHRARAIGGLRRVPEVPDPLAEPGRFRVDPAQGGVVTTEGGLGGGEEHPVKLGRDRASDHDPYGRLLGPPVARGRRA